MPELIELVLVGVHAGLTAPQAMLRLSQIAPLPLRPALEALELRLRGGDRFADALQALTERAGPSYRPLVFTLALAERTGDPIASVLDRLADEARRHRRRLADASARELPVRLAVPLVSCTLPAFVLLTIVPVLAGALSSLRWLPAVIAIPVCTDLRRPPCVPTSTVPTSGSRPATTRVRPRPSMRSCCSAPRSSRSLLVGWATAGGGAGKIGQLLDRVIDSVIDRV